MKKSLKAVISAIVVISLIWLCVMPLGAVEIKRYYGDINNDSYITTQDAQIALLIATKIYDEELSNMDFEAADINHDGAINTLDARLILRTASGLLTKELIEGYEFDENPAGFLKKVNELRAEEDPKNHSLVLDTELCKAAKIAAEEYTEKTGTAFTREDGSFYYDLLDEQGINYNYADKIIITASFGYKEAFKVMEDNLQSKKALCNGHFEKFGVGAYTKDGHTFYWCVFLTD